MEKKQKSVKHLNFQSLLTLSPENIVNPRLLSGAISLHDSRPVSQAQQKYDTDPSVYPLNKPIPKIEALVRLYNSQSKSIEKGGFPFSIDFNLYNISDSVLRGSFLF